MIEITSPIPGCAGLGFAYRRANSTNPEETEAEIAVISKRISDAVSE